MQRLVCVSVLRELLLNAAPHCARKATRVSGEVYDGLEQVIEAVCLEMAKPMATQSPLYETAYAALERALRARGRKHLLTPAGRHRILAAFEQRILHVLAYVLVAQYQARTLQWPRVLANIRGSRESSK